MKIRSHSSSSAVWKCFFRDRFRLPEFCNELVQLMIVYGDDASDHCVDSFSSERSKYYPAECCSNDSAIHPYVDACRQIKLRIGQGQLQKMVALATFELGTDFNSFGTMKAESLSRTARSCVDCMTTSIMSLAAVLPLMLLICVFVDRFFSFKR